MIGFCHLLTRNALVLLITALQLQQIKIQSPNIQRFYLK